MQKHLLAVSPVSESLSDEWFTVLAIASTELATFLATLVALHLTPVSM